MTSKKDTIRLVNKAWQALPHLQGAGWGDGKEKLFDVTCKEEKAHRKFAPDGHRHSTTVADSARLMCVYDIAREIVKPTVPTSWGDMLGRRESWLLAAGLTVINHDVIVAAWERDGVDVGALAELDYAEFVK